MSERESNERDVPCYLLPEDSQLRLAKLRDYMDFLSRLAQPRTWDEEREWAPEVPVGELSICLELLAEQADLVLGEMSWSARRQVVARAAGHDGDREAEPETEPEPNAEPHAKLEADPDAEPEAAPEMSDAAGKRLVYGLTVDQVDALNPLVRTISAHGDVLAISDPDDLADGTVSTLGQAIQDAAIEVREILDQLSAQRLVPRPRPRTGVGETRSAYAVAPWSLATDGARDSMSPPPARRLLVDSDRRAGRDCTDHRMRVYKSQNRDHKNGARCTYLVSSGLRRGRCAGRAEANRRVLASTMALKASRPSARCCWRYRRISAG